MKNSPGNIYDKKFRKYNILAKNNLIPIILISESYYMLLFKKSYLQATMMIVIPNNYYKNSNWN